MQQKENEESYSSRKEQQSMEGLSPPIMLKLPTSSSENDN